jgi:hypothetical protein
MKTSKWLAMFGIAAAVVMAGCSSSDDDNGGQQPKAKVRVLHASPDAPAVDVFLNGASVVTNAPFKAATAFAETNAGANAIRVNAAGTQTTVINATPTFASGRAYTVIAANKLASIEPLVVDDDGSSPPAGQVKVRVVHGAPSAPAVDVYVTPPGAALSGATPTLSNVAFKGISNALTVGAATYQIRVTATGSKTPVYDSGSVPLAGGANLVLVAVDQSAGSSPISLIGLTADPATPRIELADSRAKLRAVHASPDAPAVDILVDNTVVAPNVAFKGVFGFADVPSGTRNVKVNAAGTSTTVINVDAPLVAGRAYTAYAVGFLAGIGPLLVEDNLTPPASGAAKIRVIHGSPDAPNVDVLANDNRVLTNVPFKAASDYLTVPAGQYTFKVNPTGTTTTATQATVTLEGGRVYTALANGSVAANATNRLAIQLLTDR